MSIVLTALLEYLNLLTHVAESGLANARPVGLWAAALPLELVRFVCSKGFFVPLMYVSFICDITQISRTCEQS